MWMAFIWPLEHRLLERAKIPYPIIFHLLRNTFEIELHRNAVVKRFKTFPNTRKTRYDNTNVQNIKIKEIHSKSKAKVHYP